MRFFAKRIWLALGALSIASMGCGHTRSEKVAPTPCDHCSVKIASRTSSDPSVFVVETPQIAENQAPSLAPITTEHSPLPAIKTSAVKAMPSTIIPSPMPSIPSSPSEMPKSRVIPPMPTELPKNTSLLPRVETSMKVSAEPIALPANLPVDLPKTKLPTSVTKSTPAKEKIGFAADYSWMVGQLEYSKNKQIWRVRYASHEVEDTYGGSVTLVGADDLLEKLADGDLVKIDGQLVDPDLKIAAPNYRVIGVRKID